ncbi:MAG: M23 family metallopeptidase [Alphaproteobacteria bacterium]|nr:M23 family metallopeptidase [Alphaproteobacteria bacterium]
MSNKLIYLALLFLPFCAYAQEPQFILPLECTLGQDCWTVNYVDVDPQKDSVSDFKCTSKSYDGHKGTDFAIPSVHHMKMGVDVLAADSGKVLRIRDGENDDLKSEEELKHIQEERKECGNAVLIDHGNGLQTMYCHLKQDSVVVQPDQKVRQGQKIGQVGQSGFVQFPHLHFGVHWEGGIIDPFTGMLSTEGCGRMKKSFWKDDAIAYEPFAIFDGGFRPEAPDFEAIKRGEKNPDEIALNSAAFVFWAGFYNLEKGDKITLRMYDPQGRLFNERIETMEKNRARQFFFTGRKIGKVQLMKGTYKGLALVEREGLSRKREFSVDVR